MPRKRQAKVESGEDTRTPEEIAEERIAAWKRGPKKIDHNSARFGAVTGVLDLSDLGLKKVPETLREACNLELLLLAGNEIQELPRWFGELSALKAIGLVENQLRTLPPEIGSSRGLVGLFLGKNQLELLPETLRTLPRKELTLDSNPALGLPDSIMTRPPAEILR